LYLEARQQAGEEFTPHTPIFISVARNNFGHRLTRRSIQRIVDKYLTATNLKHTPGRTLSAHSLRHTAGTLALRTGSDLRQVQDLLGHSSKEDMKRQDFTIRVIADVTCDIAPDSSIPSTIRADLWL
jgi:site-specific recombinase XerD